MDQIDMFLWLWTEAEAKEQAKKHYGHDVELSQKKKMF